MVCERDSLRGKCKEMSGELAASNKHLILVRGFYVCPIWGKQQHWWCKTTDGEIVDVTACQFPSNGNGEYVEFDGTAECANCGTLIAENDIEVAHGNNAFCSYKCYMSYVGL